MKARQDTARFCWMASGEEEGLFDFLPEQAAPERVGGGLPRLRFAERITAVRFVEGHFAS